jgi:hypothetical protein
LGNPGRNGPPRPAVPRLDRRANDQPLDFFCDLTGARGAGFGHPQEEPPPIELLKIRNLGGCAPHNICNPVQRTIGDIWPMARFQIGQVINLEKKKGFGAIWDGGE